VLEFCFERRRTKRMPRLPGFATDDEDEGAVVAQEEEEEEASAHVSEGGPPAVAAAVPVLRRCALLPAVAAPAGNADDMTMIDRLSMMEQQHRAGGGDSGGGAPVGITAERLAADEQADFDRIVERRKVLLKVLREQMEEAVARNAVEMMMTGRLSTVEQQRAGGGDTSGAPVDIVERFKAEEQADIDRIVERRKVLFKVLREQMEAEIFKQEEWLAQYREQCAADALRMEQIMENARQDQARLRAELLARLQAQEAAANRARIRDRLRARLLAEQQARRQVEEAAAKDRRLLEQFLRHWGRGFGR
jgi:hypothetical protein